jgi:soluble lytic murein transglycosylase-like protein
MRLRLFALLVVAAGCTWLAGAFSGADEQKTGRAQSPPERPVRAADRPCPIARRVRPAFERAADRTGLPLALLVAVARAPSARKHALDVRLPPSNVLAGARYLRLMLDRFHSTDLALAAYDAGPTAVAKAGGAPTARTLTYVAKVTRLWRRYNGCS